MILITLQMMTNCIHKESNEMILKMKGVDILVGKIVKCSTYTL
jgi:hypothetical protein